MRWRATLRRRRVLAGTASILLLAACARPTIDASEPGSSEAPTAESTESSMATVPAATEMPMGTLPPIEPILDERFEVAFGDPRQIADDHTCAGANVSPALRWTEIPAGTVEIAVMMQGEPPLRGPARENVQWAVVGIAPTVTDVAQGSVPAGATAVIPYSATCAAETREAYIFTLVFLSTPVPAGQDPRDPYSLKQFLREHSIESRTTVGYRNIDGRPATGF
ncbi:MAG: hypothetical protein NTZ21_14620 [Actinobacteria bacterium]|nr:hypothetical protein [Actinomycetota bacterium]